MIEVMVILIILGIVMASAIPGIARYTRHDRVRSAAEDFRSTCMRTRARAMATRTLHRVAYNEGTRATVVEQFSGGSWSMVSPDTIRAAHGVTMEGESGGDESNHVITFEPIGTVSATDSPASVWFFNAESDTSTISVVRTGRIVVRHD